MMPDPEAGSSTTKNSYSKLKNSNIKSKFYKHIPTTKSTDRKLDFEKFSDLNKTDFKKTEFIIPKNLSRKNSEEKDTLSKYLRDNANVQSCTIHINELLNSGIRK